MAMKHNHNSDLTVIAPQALLDNATHNYSTALKMLTMHSIGLTRGKCPPDVVAKNAKAAFDFYKISESVTSDEALNAYHMVFDRSSCSRLTASSCVA